jgi:gliding motility-associated-like protein
MVKKIIRLNLIVLLITLFCSSVSAQISINKPVLSFTEICASPSFNNFSLQFAFSPAANLQAGNIFKVELSDATGGFTSPVQLTTTTSNSSPISITFQIPTNLNGLGYKIRVKSTSPIATSPSSDPFAALYKAYEQGFKINNEISNQSFCENTTYQLNITPDISGSTPTVFPQLTYLWFKNNIVIAGEITSTLAVTTAGTYYCKINYGNCPSNSQSNAVIMTAVPAQILSISSLSTILCGTQSIAISSSIVQAGNIYEWYKDNQPLSNSNVATYNATLPGNYFLKIINNSCITSSNILTLTTQDFNVVIDSGPTFTIVPGQNVTLNAITNATMPNYSWYKDSVLQTGNLSNFTINQSGAYKVVVNQTTGCLSQEEATTIVSYPSNYSLLVNYSTSYSECESNSTTLSVSTFTGNTNINMLTSGAPIAYQWFKNGTVVSGANTNTISISNFVDNGIYTLNSTLANGTIITSNPLSVKLKFISTLVLTSSSTYICNSNPSVVISPNIQNNLYIYNWFKVGSAISLSNSQTFSANIEGDYFLKLSYLGCEITSNIVVIKKADAPLLITNYENEITINQGETITITASGADAYLWYIMDQPNVSTPSIEISQAGVYSLIGTFGNCTVEKIFTVIISDRVSNDFIPNAITPNNDGYNDAWIIPEEFAYKDDVEVVIFNSRQEILFRTKNYLNNWPITPVSENMVYYYKIIKESTVLEKGTISILK